MAHWHCRHRDSLFRGDFAEFHRSASALLQTIGIGANIVLSNESGRQIVDTLHPYSGRLSIGGSIEQVRSVFATGKPLIAD